MDAKRLVEAGYDRVAESYLATKDADDPATRRALEEMARSLPRDGAALDLGCGAGIPVTRWLAERFAAVTGVDFSARQIELAREHVPLATFVQADIGRVRFEAESFDAVTAFYSIIHLPREEHPALLARIYGWLRPGGAFLATWALTEWQGEEHDWYGAPMWWSHYDGETNLNLIQNAGFAIQSAETSTSGDETWLWVLARKPS